MNRLTYTLSMQHAQQMLMAQRWLEDLERKLRAVGAEQCFSDEWIVTARQQEELQQLHDRDALLAAGYLVTP